MSPRRRTPFAGFLLLAAAAAAVPAARSQTPTKENPAQPPTTRPAAPAPRPARVPTVADTLIDLREVEEKGKEAERRAFIAGIELMTDIGRGDFAAVRKAIDTTGYQPLPNGEELPDDPGRALPADDIVKWVKDRPRINVPELPRRALHILDVETMRTVFPAAARWMKPKDFALILTPQPDHPEWIATQAFVILRERNERIYAVGGNLLEAFDKPNSTPHEKP